MSSNSTTENSKNPRSFLQFKTILSLVVFLLMGNSSSATHLAGADLTYRWLSGNNYEISVTLYRDCSGVAAPNNVTLSYRSASGNHSLSATLPRVSGTGQEITFACVTQPSICVGGSQPGLQKYVYRGNVTLPSQRTDWIFSFQTCCRNCAITTIVHSPTCNTDPGMYVEAKLNNLTAPTNSSPTFLNVPVAFICTNQGFTFNHGVNDIDGDSLVYSFIAPKVSATADVTFNPGYSATSPITSSPPVTIHANSGDINMTPTMLEVGVTAVLVSEYRNGVFIGSVTRDMQFWTTNCAPNVLPTATGINGTATFSTTICAGTNLCFNIFSNDANGGQIVDMTWNNGIPSATFNTAGSPYPTGTFCWTPTLADARPQPYSFTVTVRDDNCPLNGFQTYSYTVFVPLVTAPITPSNNNGFGVACNGAATGSATANPSGGTAPYTYSWSNGQTTQTATGLSANTLYSVVVTTSAGCTTSADVTLTEPAVFTSSISASTNASCNGAVDGQATALGSDGVAPYSYLWSDGQTTAIATSLAAGPYSVTLTDANGCTSIQNITITEPAVLIASVSTQTNAGCNGESTGEIDLVVSGGTSAYSYLWSNGATTQDLSGLPAGTYSVTVTDANACTANENVTITEPGALVPLITSATINGGANVSCNGGNDATANASATGGTLPYNYLWSPGGETTAVISSLGAGPISVLITDANGCSAGANYSITEPALLEANLISVSLFNGGFNISCNGLSDGSIDVGTAGGTAGYTYLWSSSETTEDLSGIPAGAYSLTVTDLNGCTANLNVNILEPDAILANVTSQSNVGCMGESNGAIDLTISGGAAPYTYAWSNGATTEDISALSAGTYNVTVTDDNGCTGMQSVTITEPAVLVPLITSAVVSGGNNLLCNGDADATASVSVTGGTAPFNYLWSNGETTASASGLDAGNVNVLVTDANGCTANDTYNVSEPAALASTLIPSAYIGGANISCPAGTDGSIDLIVSGGTAGYTFSWSTGDTTEDLTGLTAGTYTVTITDANNCVHIDNITLIDPAAHTLTLVPSMYTGGVNVSCNGATDGSIDLTVIGSTGPYTFAWSNGATTEDLSGLAAGTYDVVVTDANGCTVFATITLTEPFPLVASGVLSSWIGGNNISCFGFADGSVDLSVNGGTVGYTYLWSNGVTTQDIFGLIAGNISVTVTDTNGCTAVENFNLTEPALLIVSATVDNHVSCNGVCDGQASVASVSGGIAPYTYSWDNGDTLTVADSLCAGTYTVTVTDANGCTATDQVTITESLSLSITASVTTAVNCQAVCSGVAEVTSTTGGTAPFTYVWSNGDTGITADSLCVGSYDVTVTDANGCTAMTTVNVTQAFPILTATASVTSNALCNAACNGIANVSGGGGNPPYTYLWSNGATTASAAGLCAGPYTVTITDANGCTAIDGITITEPAILTVSAAIDNNVSCNGVCDAQASISSTSGGTAPYTYLWSTGSTAINVTGLCAGAHSVTVTDANGCTAVSNITITQPAVLAVTVSIVNNASCAGGCDGETMIASTTGGTAPYTYAWSNGDTGTNADSLCAGLVSVIVTDANGCTANASGTISQAGALIANQAVSQNASCNGVCDGLATVNPSGGTAPFVVTWSNGDTGFMADSLCAGSYTYDIKDDNGCMLSGSVTITEPAILTVSALVSSNVSCNGFCDGVADVDVISGGTAPYNLVWSNGDTGPFADSLCAGTYDLTVTDANGCISMTSVTITEPAVLALTVNVDNDASCNGVCDGQASIATTSGGTAPFSYLWSNGDAGTTADSLCAGSHSVTVTDANGCQANISFTITEPVVLAVAIQIDNNASCNGACDGQVSVSATTGGTAPFTYAWSNGDTGLNADSLCAGPITVIVTDANGCIASASMNVTAPAIVTTSIIINNQPSCNGVCDGMVTAGVTAGGTPPYTYAWSNGDTGIVADSLCAGPITLTVTDANGCIATANFILTEPAVLSGNVNVTNAPACVGNCDATASVANINGGTAPYTYLWSNGDTGTTADSLCAGSHSVIVTDAKGCVLTINFTVNDPVALTVSTAISTPISCSGVCNGAIDLTVSGGAAPYTYLWSNGATTEDLSALCEGTYSYTVTDANGCTTTGSETITAPQAISITMGVLPVSCNGGNDGEIDITPTGGTLPYTFLWSNGATTEDISGLAAGPYSVTITDANGCTLTANFTVTEPAPVNVSAGQDQNVCGTTANMNATLPAGATGVWTLVQGQGTVVDPTSPTSAVTGLVTGSFATFEWTITLNGCIGNGQVTIKSDEPVTANATAGTLTCDPIYTVSATQPQVGTGSWSTLANSGISITNPNANTTTVTGYQVGVSPIIWTVTNGVCVARDTVFITLDTPVNCTDNIEMPTAFSPNGDGKNDDFLIKGLDKFPDNTLVVFNRWGNEIYSKDAYFRDWKGEGKNGEPLPDGTYFAVLKVKNFKGSELILKGYVDLRR